MGIQIVRWKQARRPRHRGDRRYKRLFRCRHYFRYFAVLGLRHLEAEVFDEAMDIDEKRMLPPVAELDSKVSS